MPSNGWAQFVLRPDKGDLLGCGSNGALYSIDFSQDTSTPDGTATPLTHSLLKPPAVKGWPGMPKRT